MMFAVWVELVCIRCAETTAGRHTYGHIPRRAMKESAEGVGWVFKGDEAMCRFCSEQETD